MNETITLKALAQMLANATGRPVDVTEGFVTQFFALIEETLAAGESVTIKALGTFNNRDGVVEFVADSALADAVNTPFSAFSTIVLNDGELAEPKPEPEPEPEPETQDAIEDFAIDNLANGEQVAGVQHIEDEAVEEEITEEEIIEEASVEDETIDEEPIEDEPIEEEPIEETAEEQVDAVADVYDEEPVNEPVARATEAPEPQIVHHYHHRRMLSVATGVLIFVAGLIAGIALGYLFKDKISNIVSDNSLTSKPNLVIDADTVTIVQPKSVFVEKQTQADTVATRTDSSATTKPAAKPADAKQADTKPAVQPKAQPETKTPRYDTVNGKVYLATLARKYYGKAEYWVYIYDANKLRHPDRIKPGTRLLIPYIEDVRTSADDSVNLARAKQRAAQIYATVRK